MYRNLTSVQIVGMKYSADVSQNTVMEKINLCHIILPKVSSTCFSCGSLSTYSANSASKKGKKKRNTVMTQ